MVRSGLSDCTAEGASGSLARVKNLDRPPWSTHAIEDALLEVPRASEVELEVISAFYLDISGYQVPGRIRVFLDWLLEPLAVLNLATNWGIPKRIRFETEYSYWAEAVAAAEVVVVVSPREMEAVEPAAIAVLGVAVSHWAAPA